MERIQASAALARLTNKQVEVLALIAQHRLVKEVAWELGISEDTVAQRMKRVQTLLGVSSRAEAARMYITAYSSEQLYDRVVYDAPGIDLADDSATESGSFGSRAGTNDGIDTLHQPEPAYDAGFVNWPQDRFWYARLLEAGRSNDLTSTMRTVLMLVMTLAAILSVAVTVSVAEGLSRLF